MAIHWQIPFKSERAGNVYTVNIYDSSYTGNPITLRGGAQPFETQEDDDEDEFTPIRTQTGYIRVVDDGSFNWKDVIPTSSVSRPVTLTNNGGTVLWRGYMQPQSYSGTLYGNPQEREFPIFCPLSVLDAYDFDPTTDSITNFAYILWLILDKTGDFDEVSFQGGDVVEGWLQKQCSWLNFAEEDEDHHLSAKYSYMSILEDICKFFGWTCRIYRSKVVFTMADDSLNPSFLAYDMQGLYRIGTGESDYGNEESWSSAAIGDIFASVSNDDNVLQGIRRARIEANINKTPNIMEVPYDEITDRYADNSIVRTDLGDNKYLFEKKQAEANEHTLSFAYLDILFGPGGSFVESGQTYYYFGSEHIYEYYEGALNQKHTYNFTTNLLIKGQHPNDGYLIRLMSRSTYALSSGYIVISGKTFVDVSGTNYIGNGEIIASLKVGNKYWNGSSWQSSWCEFNIGVGQEGSAVGAQGTGQILNNRVLTSDAPEYDGHGIKVNEGLGGIVQLDIRGFNDSTEPYEYGRRGLCIEGLKVSFLRNNNDTRERNIYKADASNEFTGEPTVDLIFASDNNNQFGSGIIMNADGSYCQTLTYSDGNTAHPEQHTVDRMAAFGSSVRRCISTDLLTHNGSGTTAADGITAQHKVTLDGDTFHPISIKRKWRDDIVRLTLLEI